MGTTVLAMPIWRGALLLACAVALTCASAESAYPEVTELNEMGEGSPATAEGRSLADPSKDKVKAAKSILEAVAKQNVKAEKAKMQKKVEKEKEEVKEEKKALIKAQKEVREE